MSLFSLRNKPYLVDYQRGSILFSIDEKGSLLYEKYTNDGSVRTNSDELFPHVSSFDCAVFEKKVFIFVVTKKGKLTYAIFKENSKEIFNIDSTAKVLSSPSATRDLEGNIHLAVIEKGAKGASLCHYRFNNESYKKNIIQEGYNNEFDNPVLIAGHRSELVLIYKRLKEGKSILESVSYYLPYDKWLEKVALTSPKEASQEIFCLDGLQFNKTIFITWSSYINNEYIVFIREKGSKKWPQTGWGSAIPLASTGNKAPITLIFIKNNQPLIAYLEKKNNLSIKSILENDSWKDVGLEIDTDLFPIRYIRIKDENKFSNVGLLFNKLELEEIIGCSYENQEVFFLQQNQKQKEVKTSQVKESIKKPNMWQQEIEEKINNLICENIKMIKEINSNKTKLLVKSQELLKISENSDQVISSNKNEIRLLSLKIKELERKAKENKGKVARNSQSYRDNYFVKIKNMFKKFPS